MTIDGKTAAPPYVYNQSSIDPITGADLQYDIEPLITVGDEVPLLEGTFGRYTPGLDNYAMAGIPDGLGYVELNGLRYVFMNHEFAEDVTTDVSSTVEGQINGSRVSVFVFDQNWNAIGGRNLIETAKADGGTYKLNLESGNYELLNTTTGLTDPTQILNGNDHGNFTRFCSGYLANSGFFNENNRRVPFWFAPEESTATADNSVRSRGWAVSATGEATALDGLGVYAKEQVLSPVQWRATNSDYTVLLSTEDFRNGELYMYVGKQTAANPNGFTNIGRDFDLYVLRVVDPQTRRTYQYETMPENQELIARWQRVPDSVVLPARGGTETGFQTQEKLSNWVDAVVNNQARSTNFRRLEDIAEDPNNPNTFYVVSTGTNDVPPGATVADNRFGRLYRFNIDVDRATGVPRDGTLEMLLQGGPRTGVSYDNLVVDSNGKVLINEDRTAGGGDVMDAYKRNGRVVGYDINFNEPRVGNDTVDNLFEINQSAEGRRFNTGFGNWETSGIIEVPTLGSSRSSYLFDVQAHSIGNDSGVYTGRYEEGGQLLLTTPLDTPPL